jgi:hypothetical protein
MRHDSSGARGADRDFQEAAAVVARARRCPPGIVPFPILARATLSKAAAHARPATARVTGLAAQIRHQDSLGRPDSVVSGAIWAAEGHRGGASRPASAAISAQCHRVGKSARTRCRGGRRAGAPAQRHDRRHPHGSTDRPKRAHRHAIEQTALQPGDHLAGDAGSDRHVHLTKVSSHPNVLDHQPDLHIVTHVPRMV